VDVEGGAKSGVGFTHYTPDYLESLGKAPGEGKLDRRGRGFAVSAFRDIGGEKTVYNDRVNISISWVRQAVATFDLGQEALGHEEALLFNRCREHHIVPQGHLPARLAFGRLVNEAGGARRPRWKLSDLCTNAKDECPRKRTKTELHAIRLCSPPPST
jgi:hypothetical protein